MPHGTGSVNLTHYPLDINAALHMLTAAALDNDFFYGRYTSFAVGNIVTSLDSSLATPGWSIRSTKRLNDNDQIAAVGVRTSAPNRPIAVRLDKTSCP